MKEGLVLDKLRVFLKTGKRTVIFFLRQFHAEMLLLVVRFFPEQAYRFLPRLPDPGTRIRKEANPLNEFPIIRELSCRLQEYEEINIVMRGVSFSRELLSTLEAPVVLVNWDRKEEGNKFIYATADCDCVKRFVANNMFPIFCVEDIMAVKDPSFQLSAAHAYIEQASKEYPITVCEIAHKCGMVLNYTSGVAVTATLGQLSRKVNVYGWDEYASEPMAKWSLWKVISHMFVLGIGRQPAGRISIAISNYHYAIRFQELAHFTIQGYSRDLARFPALKKKLEKIIYR